MTNEQHIAKTSQDEMEFVYHRTNEHIKELRKIYSDGKCTDCENYNNCEYLPEYDEDGNCLILSEEGEEAR